MDSGDIPDIQEAEEAPSAQGKVAGQAGTPAVVGVETRSKAALAATALATPSQDPPPRSEQDREVTLGQLQLEEFQQLPTQGIPVSQQVREDRPRCGY